MSDKTKAILWMLYACFGAALMTIFVKILSYKINVFQMVFFRNLIALVMFLPWLLKHGDAWYDLTHAKTSQYKIYLLRAINGFVVMNLYFYVLTIVPLTVVASLSFISPIVTALLAIIFFGERYGVHRWFALIMGFVGVLIVIRPGTEDFDINSLWVLVIASMWSIAGIIIKFASKSDDPKKIVFYMVFMMTPLSVPMAYLNWQPVPTEAIPYILALGIVSNIFQVALSRAISLTDFSTILPYDFSRLVFVTILTYFVFDEVIDFQTAIGAVVIMSSAVYASYREKLKKINVQKDSK